ncbi:unnamed protein product [Durusdinium trenchii]|uniref:Photolyase/cryptochrome alpha/beta domain-containing protein n=1 Tax=Durusdinium trenchii TaxID=1381693 RepID=A0ABP0HGZ6_9DINO
MVRRWVRSAGTTGPTGGEGAKPKPAAERVNVVWHKWSDLRLLDHEPLWHAHQRPEPVLHLHLVELQLLAGHARVSGVQRCSPRRKEFWRQCVEDLSERLQERGQHLVVRAVEDPAEFFASLCEQLPILRVYAHQEFCDEELQIEASVRRVLAQHGAELCTYWGALTVHHIDDLGFDARDRNQMPWYKGEFQRAAKRRPIREERQVFRWKGGETAALEHLKSYMESGALARYRGATESFAHGSDNPVNGGTRLSPWLAFGCLSARMVVKEARDWERQHGKSCSTSKGVGKIGSTGNRLHTELLFRDFLRFSALAWGTSLFKIGGPFGVTGIPWRKDLELFEKWRLGQTGFPFVDAGMRELAATGYISHLHRQCCAAFLARDLGLDWRMGAEHFESCLLDHTPDANWGNWAYRILQRPCLAETRRSYPLEEHLNTVEVVVWPAVHDAFLEHTLHWVPELSSLPKDLAREPWRTEGRPLKRIPIKPYQDSPLWFCAANRTNWDYEYFWLPGHAWVVQLGAGAGEHPWRDFQLSRDYFRPLIPALNVEIDLDALPLRHAWGDTPPQLRPHIWGGGLRVPQRSPQETSKGKGGSRRGMSTSTRASGRSPHASSHFERKTHGFVGRTSSLSEAFFQFFQTWADRHLPALPAGQSRPESAGQVWTAVELLQRPF